MQTKTNTLKGFILASVIIVIAIFGTLGAFLLKSLTIKSYQNSNQILQLSAELLIQNSKNILIDEIKKHNFLLGCLENFTQEYNNGKIILDFNVKYYGIIKNCGTEQKYFKDGVVIVADVYLSTKNTLINIRKHKVFITKI